MAKTKIFVSFDYDHDQTLKQFLIGQSQQKSLVDWSIGQALTGNWKANARKRIKAVDVVAVICGEHTDKATGVSAEIEIAQEEGISYFLLAGYAEKTNRKPKAAKPTDKVHNWTWENLNVLLGGSVK